MWRSSPRLPVEQPNWLNAVSGESARLASKVSCRASITTGFLRYFTGQSFQVLIVTTTVPAFGYDETAST